MASWFKQRRDRDDVAADTAAESTIEVKAHVIADAVRAAEQQRQQQLQQQQQQQQVRPPGIAADGVVAGGDFTDGDFSGGDFSGGDFADGVLAGGVVAGGERGPEALALDQALAERRSLVQLCLYALDRARSAGVVERLEEGLAGVGVDAIRPDGARFDPAHHEAGGTVATADEALDGVVAETEVVGFADRGEVLRAPIVTVYSKSAP